jgi:glycosyltransferase involved in cell wall biosynthesis
MQRRGLAAMTASFSASILAAFGRYDVVHFHAEGPCAAIWLPKLFGKKCIATIHGLDHQRAKWGKFAAWYIRFGEKCAVRFADEIIVLSRNVQEYFKENYGRETAYIPNGVQRLKKHTAQIITEKYGLHNDDYLLFLGRLVPEKGLRYLIMENSLQTTDILFIGDRMEKDGECAKACGVDHLILKKKKSARNAQYRRIFGE